MSIQNGDQVWIVGQVRAIVPSVPEYDSEACQLWEFTGVFCTRDEAIAACRDRTYFVMGPVTVGEAAPHETTPNWVAENFYPIDMTEGDSPLPGEVFDV